MSLCMSHVCFRHIVSVFTVLWKTLFVTQRLLLCHLVVTRLFVVVLFCRFFLNEAKVILFLEVTFSSL